MKYFIKKSLNHGLITIYSDELFDWVTFVTFLVTKKILKVIITIVWIVLIGHLKMHTDAVLKMLFFYYFFKAKTYLRGRL